MFCGSITESLLRPEPHLPQCSYGLENGLVSSHKSVGRGFIFNVLCSYGYQPPTCLCQDGIRGWYHFAFM